MERQKWFFSKKFIGFLTSLALLLSVAVTPMAASPVGDLNGDNIVSAPDLATLTTVIITGNKDIAYDVNGDGLINILDLVRLKKKLAFATTTVTLPVVPVDGKVPEGGLTLAGGGVSAFVPEGVLLEDGVDSLTLTVTPIISPSDDVEVSENENITSYDVHISGISKENTVPIIVELGAVMPKFLNIGNYRIYHLENGEKVLMTLVDSKEELTAHNQFTYEPETGKVTVAMATFSEVAMIADNENVWNGNITAFNKGDGSEENPYIVSNADQLAYLNDRVSNDNENYDDKHYKLIADLYFGGKNAENIWYPIGYWAKGEGVNTVGETWYTFGGAFGGTFDGNGHEISGIHQNTWSMDGDYEDGYWDAAMGLFGYVENGTVKNLTVDSFTSNGEFTPTGVISAYAVNSTFENIALTNCNPRVYNTGNGGIVGIGGNNDDTEDLKLTFTNITIDNSNKISALWGSWDVACGGLVGMFRGAGHVYMTNCHVAAQIDVNNDVCGNYQYYWYRYAGMMIGTNKNMITENGKTLPETSKYHAEGCTVHFGDWNDYYYCELVDNTLASYTHDHQFSRLQKVKAVNGTTITYLDDTQAEVPESGRYNFVVVNGEASTANATCYHFKDGAPWSHEDGGYETTDIDGDGVVDSDVLKEDKQHIYLPFNQLFTGYGWGVNHIPVYNGKEYAFEGITILDRVEATSDDKFAIADNAETAFTTGVTVKIGDLFKDNTEVGTKNPILSENVKVFVSPVDESSNVSATYSANASDWKQGTLTFAGLGVATVSITDYYFCNTATISVTISEPEDVEKFVSTGPKTIVLANGDNNVVSLGELFTAVDSAEIDSANVTVTVTTSDGDVTGEYNADSNDWKNGTVSFTGNGTAVVTITDNNYCIEASNTVKLDSANKVKFAAIENVTVEDILTDDTVTLSEIFNATGNADIKDDSVTITVSGVDYVLTENASDWTQSTIKFSGIGTATITITDGFYCEEATNTLTVDVIEVEKFDLVFENTAKYLYRVGNASGSTVKLATLFKDSGKGTIGTPAVTFETVSGDATGTFTSNATWTNGTIQFGGTGVVKVSITDNNYCIPTDLYLEVVNAVNATGATNATANNVVLLNDCGFGSLEVSNGYTLFGNGFTMTCSSDAVAVDRTYSFVTLNGGTLDNVQIVTPNFSHAIMYEKNKTENNNPSNTDSNGRTRYYNIRSAVVVQNSSKITNSYISGGRVAIYAISGTLTLENSTVFGGAVANIQTERSSKLILEDTTLIQKPIKANVNDTSKTLMGFSVVTMCDTEGYGAEIELKGYLKQYAWANSDYTSYVPKDAQSFVSSVLEENDYKHNITYEDGVTRNSVNLGFANMPTDGVTDTKTGNITDTREQKDNMPYDWVTIKTASIYTYKNSNGTDNSVKNVESYTANTQGITLPYVTYNDTNANRVFSTTFDSNKAQWKSTLKVDVDAGEYSFSFDKLLVQKNGSNLIYTVKNEDGTVVNKNDAIYLNSSISNVYILTVTDDNIFDINGNKTGNSVEYSYMFELLSTKTSLPAPEWISTTLTGTPYIVADNKNSDWNCAVPVLDGLQVKYWSKKQNKEVELNLSDVVTAAGLSSGLQNGSNNNITITVADEYTLTVSTTGFKTNDNGKPVVVNNKLYFTVASSSNYVSTNTTNRTITINYTFTDANNSEPIKIDGKTFDVVYATYKSNQYKYSDFCNGKLTDAPTSCFTPDTLITLADGNEKRVDELTFEDKILAWDFFTGSYVEKSISLLVNHGANQNAVIYMEYSDGTLLKIIGEHGVFDYELNKFVYITAENVEDYIGHRFVKHNLNGGYDIITLTNGYVVNEYVEAWSITSAGTSNTFGSGLLTVAPPEDFYNWIEMGGKLHYDAEQFAKDVETYGLYTYDDFKDYVSYEQFVDWNGAYLKIAVEKGYFTFEYILELIDLYKGWMPK